MALISNGTTIFDNGSMASGFGADLKFISKATASASSSISFTSGIDSTYKEYVFYFVNMHPQNDNVKFGVNFSTDGGSNYNTTKTTTTFTAIHNEGDTQALITYNTAEDLAQQTTDQFLHPNLGNGNDECSSGFLHLFNPASTTYVKHFIATYQGYSSDDYSQIYYTAGYNNTTSAINAVKFECSAGTIESGEILLFGIN